MERLAAKIAKIVRSDKARLCASYAVFVLGLVLVLVYICIFERSEVNNDYTDTLLWAYESVKGRGLYNHDFIYAYMLPFGGSLIMLPFALIFGFAYPAHVLGMCTFAILYSVILYLFFKILFDSRRIGLTLSGTVMILLTCSKAMRLIFWGHVIQYSLGIALLIIGILIVRKIYETNNINYYIALFIWTGLCMTNGANIVPFFFAPLLVGVLFERFFDLSSKLSDTETGIAVRITMLMLAAGLLGYGFNIFTQRNLDKTYLNALFSFRSTGEWFYSLNSWLSTWCSLGADVVNSGDKLMSLNGIITCGLMVFCFVVMIVPIVACFFYKQIDNKYIRILIIAHHTIFIFSLIMLSVIFTANFNWRLGGAFASCIIVSLVFSVWLTKQPNLSRFGYLLLFFFGVCAILSMLRVSRLDSAKGSNVYDRVIDALESENQVYGYGDVWDANAITMLSNSKVKMRSIAFEDWNEGKYVIDWYQCEKGWYDDQDGVTEYFVYLDANRYAGCSEHLKEAASRTVVFEDGAGYIMIFDGNIFEDGKGIYNPED